MILGKNLYLLIFILSGNNTRFVDCCVVTLRTKATPRSRFCFSNEGGFFGLFDEQGKK